MHLTQNTDLVSQTFDGLLCFLAKFGDISLQVGDIWLGCQIVLQQCAKHFHLDDRLLFTEANFLQLSGVVKGIENQHACSDFL
jgi:transketolase N-terminal domain/subunit